MKFQIKNKNGDIVDKNLSHEEASLWIDNSIGKEYAVEPMKESDQN